MSLRHWSCWHLLCMLSQMVGVRPVLFAGETFQFLWLAFLCWCSRGFTFPMCCPPVLIRSLHVAHTCYFSCCPPVSFYRSTWLSLVTSVVTSRWVQRLECDAHCRVCNPRVEAERSLYSLSYGALRREWLLDPDGSAALALHSVWQGHTAKAKVCAQCNARRA